MSTVNPKVKSTEMHSRRLMDIINSIEDRPLSSKIAMLILHIANELESKPRNLSCKELQTIDLPITDPGVQYCLSKKKHPYYIVLNHLVDSKLLFKIKGSRYLVNPDILNVFTKEHWEEWSRSTE